VLASAGIIALVFGTLTLVEGPIPELRVALLTAIACGVGFGLITAFLVRIAIVARRNKVLTGVDALVGTLGIAQEVLNPRGQILVHGELWSAEAPESVQPGDMVKVRAVRGLTLLVDRVPTAV
jgi:membrane-bound serine protease (ClpP class)